jgi:hypothetical protein
MSKDKSQHTSHPPTQAEVDHRARQLHPENELYWKSRGYPGRPENWKTLLQQEEAKHEK